MNTSYLSKPAQKDLFQAYADWRTWTEAERAGIMAGDWKRVEECQSQKSRLQTVIIQLTPEAQKETGKDAPILERHLRLIVDELIVLETNNGEIISLQRAQAQAEYAELNKTSQKLRKVQRGYGMAPATAWQSYS
jgi:hypothetical protein